MENDYTIQKKSLPPFDCKANTKMAVKAAEEDMMPIPETLDNPAFVPGFLKTQIGKTMRVEFFIGNQMTDRVGKLLEVGASYILLQEFRGMSTLMCDLFAIKFVTIANEDIDNPLLI